MRHPDGDLQVNETRWKQMILNDAGTAPVAHWDVPDCGNTEFSINLGSNAHLDDAYGGYCVGGYCVFAHIAQEDSASWLTVEKIRDHIQATEGATVPIQAMVLE